MNRLYNIDTNYTYQTLQKTQKTFKEIQTNKQLLSTLEKNMGFRKFYSGHLQGVTETSWQQPTCYSDQLPTFYWDDAYWDDAYNVFEQQLL